MTGLDMADAAMLGRGTPSATRPGDRLNTFDPMVGVPVLYNGPRLKAQGPCCSGFPTPRSPVNMRGRSQIGGGLKADLIAAKQVLEPRRLLEPAEILEHVAQLKIHHGIYGWWFDEALPEVPRDGCFKLDGKNLLYVGISPSSLKYANSGRTLSGRIKNHLSGNIGNSTLRLSLSALLQKEFQFQFWRAGKKARMTCENEGKLTEWIFDNAKVSVAEYSMPWQLEGEIIQRGPTLPLNLKDNRRNPFEPTLSDLRQSLGRN